MANVSKHLGLDIVNWVINNFDNPVRVALLNTIPSISDGTFSIGSHELDDEVSEGYTRKNLDETKWSSAVFGTDVYSSYDANVNFPVNTGGASWEPVRAIALIDNSSNVLSVVALSDSITIIPGKFARIPTGSLKLKVSI